jgi:hypothetical protein
MSDERQINVVAAVGLVVVLVAVVVVVVVVLTTAVIHLPTILLSSITAQVPVLDHHQPRNRESSSLRSRRRHFA